jgi:hypothetical protein
MPGWRFAVPYLAILAALLATGWARLLRPLAGRHAAIAPAVALAAMALLGFLHRAERREFRNLVELRADGYETGHRRLARWIRDEAAGPGDAVALMDIGIVGYACPRQRILDITGLTDRHIAKSPGTFLKKEYDPAYILDQRPEVVVVVLSAFEIAQTEVGGQPRSVRRVLAPRGPLPEEAQIGTWIRIEAEILAHPAFEAAYRRPREDPGPAAPWTERLAARYGAERVFEHAHPDQYYLLAAFRRQPPARGR